MIRDHLSHTKIGRLLACQRLFYWHYEERLSPRVPRAPLSMGRAFAEALQHSDPERGYSALMEAHARLSEANAGNPWVSIPDHDDALVQAHTVRGAARAYLDRYGSHYQTHQTREREFRVPLRNPNTGRASRTFELVGRLDAVAEDSSLIVEDKFVGRIPRGDQAWQLLQIDRQVTIGAYLVWRTTGTIPQEIRYRWTLKPQIRQRKGESFIEFLDRIEDDYVERPDHYLHEEIATRTIEDFGELERDLWRIAQMVRENRRAGHWPRNTARCTEFGGCEYLPLCAGEPGAAHQFEVRPGHEDVNNNKVQLEAA